jgi:hypothetical protein
VANPFLAQTGGNLYIQGNQSIDILALNHPETPFQSGGSMTLVSNGNVSGDAHFFSGGGFSILNLAGAPGNFVSLYDPIISSTRNVSFGDYTGVALKVEALGDITGGNITITGPDSAVNIPNTDPHFLILTTTPALVLQAGKTTLDNTPDTFIIDAGGTLFAEDNEPIAPHNITVDSINTSSSTGNGGNVILEAGNIVEPGSILVTGSIDASGIGSGGDISLSGNEINFGGSVRTSGNLLIQPLTSGQNIEIGGSTNDTPALDLTADEMERLQPGFNSIRIQSPTGDIALTGAITRTDNTSITLDGATTTLNAGITTQGGDIILDNSVRLGTDVILNTGGGNITFNGTVNGSHNLILDAGSGTTTFNGIVGGNIPLDILSTDVGGTTIINSNLTASNITLGDSVQLGTDITLSTGSTNGSITFEGSVDGAAPGTQSLTLNASNGTTTFNGIVGGINPLNTLTTEAGGTTIINSNLTANQLAFNDTVTVQSDATLIANKIDFNSNSPVSGSGTNLTLQPLTQTQSIEIAGSENNDSNVLDLWHYSFEYPQH